MKKLYNFNQQQDVLPMPNHLWENFIVPAVTGVERRLDLISINLALYDMPSYTPIPLAQNIVFYWMYSIWLPGHNIANPVDTLGGAGAGTGTLLNLHETGLYCMNGVWSDRELRFNWRYRNTDPAATIRYERSVYLEFTERRI